MTIFTSINFQSSKFHRKLPSSTLEYCNPTQVYVDASLQPPSLSLQRISLRILSTRIPYLLSFLKIRLLSNPPSLDSSHTSFHPNKNSSVQFSTGNPMPRNAWVFQPNPLLGLLLFSMLYTLKDFYSAQRHPYQQQFPTMYFHSAHETIEVTGPMVEQIVISARLAVSLIRMVYIPL